MAEFKVSPALAPQISSLNEKGRALADDTVGRIEDDVNTLKTSEEYVKQQTDIRSVLRLYSELVRKDASDMTKMMREAEKMDAEISRGYK